ncbi:MAG: terminase [Comamonas sp.]|nr:terminase [Comamonas sp.]
MNLRKLLHWQWQGYSRNHQSRFNLLLHIILVPLFLAGNITLIVGVAQLSWSLALSGIAVTVISIALQGHGHNAEVNPPEPFTGIGNALSRILLEQWITFPRFFLSGGWLRALRSSL